MKNTLIILLIVIAFISFSTDVQKKTFWLAAFRMDNPNNEYFGARAIKIFNKFIREDKDLRISNFRFCSDCDDKKT